MPAERRLPKIQKAAEIGNKHAPALLPSRLAGRTAKRLQFSAVRCLLFALTAESPCSGREHWTCKHCGATASVSCSTSAERATRCREDPDRLAFDMELSELSQRRRRPDMRAAEASSGSTRCPRNSMAPAEDYSLQHRAKGSRRSLFSLICLRLRGDKPHLPPGTDTRNAHGSSTSACSMFRHPSPNLLP